MNFKKVFKWKYMNMGGIVEMDIINDNLSIDVLKGDGLHWEAFREILWNDESFREVRAHVDSRLRRKNDWAISWRQGMSSCIDYYIDTKKSPLFIDRIHVMHISMYNKVTLPKKCWVKDVYDIINWMQREYVYQDGEEMYLDAIKQRVEDWNVTDAKVWDITESCKKRADDFDSRCFSNQFGFHTPPSTKPSDLKNGRGFWDAADESEVIYR